MLGSQYERMLELFPNSQVHILFLDDLKADSRFAYESIAEFLGIQPRSEVIDFEAKEGNTQWKSSTIRKIHENGKAIKRILGLKTNLGLLKMLRSKSLVAVKRKPLRKEFYNELLIYFDEEINKLSHITGKDLSHWKNPEKSKL